MRQRKIYTSYRTERFIALDFIMFDGFWFFIRVSTSLQIQVIVGILFGCLRTERKTLLTITLKR